MRVNRIDHHALDRFVQQCCGMVDQIRVQRIVTGNQHHQRALAAPARPARLLPERGHRPGKTSQHHRIQSGDINAQLQSVGGSQPAQLALGQGLVQRATVLGKITGPIRRHRVRQFRGNVDQSRPGTQCSQFRRAPRSDERQGLRSLDDQVGHHPGRLGTGGASHRGAVLADHIRPQRGLTMPPCEPRGEPSSVTSTTGWPIRSAAVAPGEAVVALAKITVGCAE